MKNTSRTMLWTFTVITIIVSSTQGQTWFGDTLTLNPITFNTQSPEGWNAQYKVLVNFPKADTKWSKILMIQTLKCDSATAGDTFPCGEWDYIWNTLVLIPAGDSLETYSLGSFVTPYGMRLKLGGDKGWEWEYDISEYAPLLKGQRELISGNNQELLDLKFRFIKGTPIRDVLSVENIYPQGEYRYEHLATDSLLKERQIILSDNATAFRLKAVVSGHGHAGPHNCCEWDSKTHSYYLNKWETYRWNVWKDCGNNPIFPQGGTWPFDRAGWCPGTKVDEYEFEITSKVNPGDTISIDYGIETFQDNGEKEGHFRMSHQLFSYGPPNFKHDAAIVEIISPSSEDKNSRFNPSCGNPRILIKNSGSASLKQLNISYGFQGKRKTKYVWYGDLELLESTIVDLPGMSWKKMKTPGVFEVDISYPGKMKDENPDNNKLRSVYITPIKLPGEFILSIQTNNLNRASENSYYITDSQGMIWYDSDEFEDDHHYRLPINLSKGCYQFKFMDKMEDGVSIHWWFSNSDPELVGINGKVQIESVLGDTLLSFSSDFGQELYLNFIVE